MNRWSVLLVCGALLLSACKDEDKKKETVAALGTFCHGLTVGGEETTFVLKLGSGSTMKTLSANTGECSIDLGQGCETIPAGQALPYEVLDETGTSLGTGTVDVTKDSAYVFYLDLDNDGNLSFVQENATGDLHCSSMSCDLAYYNTQTCGASDPCGWAADTYCDDLCLEIVSNPFDDSADCEVDCSSPADYGSCITCNCDSSASACFGNMDCVDLLYCVADCADDTCVTDCGATYPDGIEDLSALLDCADSYCANY